MYSTLSSYHSFSNGRENFSDSIDLVQPIVELTDSTIGTIYKKPTFLLCYAPWCSHCIRFKPIYQQLTEACTRANIFVNFAKLDCVQWPQSAAQFDIGGYPSIFFIDANKKVNAYTGQRTIPLLQAWIQSLLK